MKDNLKYTKEILEQLAQECTSIAQVIRKLGLREAGGNYSHIKRRFKHFGIDISHFTGQAHNLGKASPKRLKPDEVLILRTQGTRQHAHLLRRALIESGIDHRCSICQILPEWNNDVLTLEIDHINQNWLDDRKENLRFICPNCHSQQ
jgi:hypothetical protein